MNRWKLACHDHTTAIEARVQKNNLPGKVYSGAEYMTRVDEEGAPRCHHGSGVVCAVGCCHHTELAVAMHHFDLARFFASPVPQLVSLASLIVLGELLSNLGIRHAVTHTLQVNGIDSVQDAAGAIAACGQAPHIRVVVIAADTAELSTQHACVILSLVLGLVDKSWHNPNFVPKEYRCNNE